MRLFQDHVAAHFWPCDWADAGGAKGTRTPNPLLAKQVRYQLRHGPGRPAAPSPKAPGRRTIVRHGPWPRQP